MGVMRWREKERNTVMYMYIETSFLTVPAARHCGALHSFSSTEVLCALS